MDKVEHRAVGPERDGLDLRSPICYCFSGDSAVRRKRNRNVIGLTQSCSSVG